MKRPLLRYHGGKWKLAAWVISHFPPHRTYVEPFGGGGSVLMQKPRAAVEVYNDRWKVVVDVFRCARDPELAAELKRRLELTPYARDEFLGAYIADGDDIVERARKTIVRSFMGFGSASTNGKYITGFRRVSREGRSSPARDWGNFPQHIEAFTNRLQGIFIENMDALEVIGIHDDFDTLIYCDPPYPHETRNMRRGNASYNHEFSSDDHERLAAQLHTVRGMVLVSCYPCELYDRLYSGWEFRDCRALADSGRARCERLYLNPAAASMQRQTELPYSKRGTRNG